MLMPQQTCDGRSSRWATCGVARKGRSFWVAGTLLVLFTVNTIVAQDATFQIQEATVVDINQAFDSGALTSERLVQMYLDRIQAYDDQGPGLNSLITLNPNSLETARKLDVERMANGARGPLHGIPVLLKDNYDTFDMPTTAGTPLFAESVPPDDAFQVQRLRDSGAIILGKTNLDELAGAGWGLSTVGGQTLNPYDFTRVPGGSSGGTGAAIAANFAVLGTGSDTLGSIRGPSAFNSLVGLKPTLGLVSRDGIIPLALTRDVAGPMARTVADVAVMLDVIAGPDPGDPSTASSAGKIPASYVDSLDLHGLRDARIGLVEQLASESTDVAPLIHGAIDQMTSLGAEVVASIQIPDFSIDNLGSTYYHSFEYDMNEYIRSLGPNAPVGSVQELVQSGNYLTALRSSVLGGLRGDRPPSDDPEYTAIIALREEFRASLIKIMDDHQLDALVYPTHVSVPRIIDRNYTSFDTTLGRTANVAAFSGFPAISVPAGYTGDGLPVGIELLGRPFDEPTLLGLAYSFEQATHHRKPPSALRFDPGALEYEELIQPGATWKYVRGTEEPSPFPALDWTLRDFDDGHWMEGPGGFGVTGRSADRRDIATAIDDFSGQYTSIYIRRGFHVDDSEEIGGMLLEIDYDDGFIAYINGAEVARSDFGSLRVPEPFDSTTNVTHVTRDPERYFVDLDEFQDLLSMDGENVLAIQGLNQRLSSRSLALAQIKLTAMRVPEPSSLCPFAAVVIHVLLTRCRGRVRQRRP